jgi:hypothetical protein
MKSNFTKYTFTQRYGMEGIGDTELEYLTDEERKERWEQNSAWIEKCKKNGTFGQEYTQTVEIENDPIIDKPSKATESYSFQIIDFSDGKK